MTWGSLLFVVRESYGNVRWSRCEGLFFFGVGTPSRDVGGRYIGNGPVYLGGMTQTAGHRLAMGNAGIVMQPLQRKQANRRGLMGDHPRSWRLTSQQFFLQPLQLQANRSYLESTQSWCSVTPHVEGLPGTRVYAASSSLRIPHSLPLCGPSPAGGGGGKNSFPPSWLLFQ